MTKFMTKSQIIVLAYIIQYYDWLKYYHVFTNILQKYKAKRSKAS